MKDEQLYYFEKSPVFKAMMHFIANDDRDFIKRYLWHIKYLLYRILEDSHMISAISLTLPVFILMGL